MTDDFLLDDINDFGGEFDALPSASAASAEDVCNFKRLGQVVEGTERAVTVLLDPTHNGEMVKLGSYAMIEGTAGDYLCMVTGMKHAMTDLGLLRRAGTPRGMDNLYRTLSFHTLLTAAPHLLRPTGATAYGPPRSVPILTSPVREASQDEINQVFGDATQPGFFHVGQPLDMQSVDLAIDMRRVAERSVGLFGQSGTGKSFLARMILAGIIKERVASTLIFDMHNEYGWEGNSESGRRVKGLKQLFPGQVSIYTLDQQSSDRRKSNPDYVVTIGMDEVEPEDIEVMSSALDLSEPQIGAVYALARRLGKSWLCNLLDDGFVENYGMANAGIGISGDTGLKALANDTGQATNTLAALRRRLDPFRRYGFLKPGGDTRMIQRLMQTLSAGTSVVLEFGRYGDMTGAYIFVANFLTRRIHAQYTVRTEIAFGDKAQKPTPLMIVVEEAHKFLDPGMAKHTIFGIIARELRKYSVTLFVIDQRPSQIDSEVMSQLGTRVTALLTDPNDIAAALAQMRNADALRDVLSRLDTRQQVLIMGHAVPIPVVVQTRSYDMDFYRSMGWKTDDEVMAGAKAAVVKARGREDFDGFD